jgi:hypothetical protein
MTADVIWNYLANDSADHDRLVRIAAAAASQRRVVEVVPLFSCEPTFAYDYYKANAWSAPRDLFLQKWDALATAEMKRHVIVGDVFTFVSKYARQIKP